MTHTAKHTPGPWVVRNRDTVYAQSGRFVADCELTPYGSRPQPPNSIDEANAHLIAAAPAMYEALRRIKVLMESGDIEGKDWMEYGQIVQALAQAEGR